MTRLVEMSNDAIAATRVKVAALFCLPDRTLLLGIILSASTLSAVIGLVLSQYYAVDVVSSLLFPAEDCWLDWGTQIGRHCFCDYGIVGGLGMRANPWEPYPMFLPWNDYKPAGSNYPAAGMLPQLLFGVLGAWLHMPRLGLVGFLLVSLSALLTPAFWAARGSRGLERVVVFIALGLAAIPVWAVFDRGNSVGLVAPIGLLFLVALRRRRWNSVAIAVVLAALVKPQFVILIVAIFAARQWRTGSLAVMGVAISNFVPYLLWPRDFPNTIVQSARSALHYSNTVATLNGPYNVSFAKGIFFFPDKLIDPQRGYVSNVFFDAVRPQIGYIAAFLIIGSVLFLGQRIPPVMVGITLLATASLFPGLVFHTYLVFALPIAALVVRDADRPPGSGLFDDLARVGGDRPVVGFCVTLATALSIAPIPLPGPPVAMPIAGQLGNVGIVGSTPIVSTTAELTPLLWLVACAAIIVSYARRPTSKGDSDTPKTSATTSSDTLIDSS
ncbi:hypothetical protein A5634_14880 [Mycobacterium asiaticum]|uniref:DUF2029 domain-containing protein n=1 Tax=Mycobacterium asiaticum TaxID=1790 RepID=A0A1A3PBB6_MYCAS|nr:glycosyltransferase family 87 protein [Mycobacterium asiaticum]OBK30990.1 hypothetical protein A5634_14880 [Mycobacterium asiaticum]